MFTSRKFSFKISLLLILTIISAGYSITSSAGGIALGATRIIYPLDASQVPLSVTNSDDKNSFLIQSWVSDIDGKKNSDFIVTPPLFVIKPKKENTLRIMYVGKGLPLDRESVYYLNSKAIPSADKEKLKGNNLQIATQSVLKLFVRPRDLKERSIDAPESLKCRISGSTLEINNPSPYYVSLVQFYVGGKKQPNTMVSPKGETSINLVGGASGTVVFEAVNDYGANTPKLTCIK